MSDGLVSLWMPPLWVFIAVLARVSPLLMLAPPTRTSSVPMRIRALIAVAASLLITPIAMVNASPMPGDLFHLSLALATEALLGLLLGTVVLMAVMCLQVAGQTAGHLAGFDMALAADPSTQEEIPVISNMLGWLAIVILLIIGGHRQVLDCCLESFARYPVGMVRVEDSWLVEIGDILQHSFVVGIRAAAPLSVAMLLANLITGLLARTLPQLNVLAIGFNINALALLMLLMVTIGGVSYVYQTELSSWIGSCKRIVTVDP